MSKSNVDRLLDACKSSGKIFLSIYLDLSGNFRVYIHDPVKAYTREPVLEEMRDFKDYELAMKSWINRGRVIASKEKTFQKAVKSAIEYLEQ